MCGILGLAAVRGAELSVDDAAVCRMRDVMAHRGPDGAGLWRRDHVVLAHRRLAVVDLSEAAAQPMVTGDGRRALVYNGELYNEREVRAALAAEGVECRTRSDTEVVLLALATWGAAALPRLRGMYALGYADVEAGTLLLARDPLGIKPLYWALTNGARELVFASEPRAILDHPRVSAKPDLVTVSAYLTTIRTVLGDRTLFQGVRTLRPGEALEFDLRGEEVVIRRPPRAVRGPAPGAGREAVRDAIEDSVRRHLKADVPVCALLSGGLDSTIVAAVTKRERDHLRTYCSGAEGSEKGDLEFAREAAGVLGTVHAEAPVTREMFRERWPEMVAAMGVPLSTPNEVAINELSRRLRADGQIVALSGEGADELFAGYERPVLDAAGFEGVLPGWDWRASLGEAGVAAATLPPGEFQLHAAAWVPVDAKGAVLAEDVWRGLEGDEALRAFYREAFERVQPLGMPPAEGDDPLERLRRHLWFHRRVNLAGLLQRLDTATMLAGVEGRTPFADVEVAALAESLPVGEKVAIDARPDGVPAVKTKIALRRAFVADVPEGVLNRPKASFPLPFQTWVEDQAGVLRASAFAREVFSTAAIEAVAANPGGMWRLAWPMINLAMWGARWW